MVTLGPCGGRRFDPLLTYRGTPTEKAWHGWRNKIWMLLCVIKIAAILSFLIKCQNCRKTFIYDWWGFCRPLVDSKCFQNFRKHHHYSRCCHYWWFLQYMEWMQLLNVVTVFESFDLFLNFFRCSQKLLTVITVITENNCNHCWQF